MKISERFNLHVTQHEIDFVNIDTARDTPLFLDPFFLATRPDPWSIKATRTIRNFFETFVRIVIDGNHDQARALFNHLHEPNETCLGLSKGDPQGRAIGEENAERLFQSVLESRALQTGVVEDLEDFRLFIRGVDKDKVSDMTTNIIRRSLMSYTEAQCALWEIPLRPDVPSGFFWNAATRSWENVHAPALVIDERKILLTPKSVVSFVKRYTPKKYYSSFVLEYLQHEHLKMGTALVQYRRNGDAYVTKKSLGETVAPYSKDFLAHFTEAHPDVFQDFRQWATRASKSLNSNEIADEDIRVITNFLRGQLAALEAGPDNAKRYHRLSAGILELLLYPSLTSPVVETEINEGRKRIDISFDNAANVGFFQRVHATYHIPAQFIFVECKNYTKDVANPEVDQLIGRFSVNHGKVGLLVFREVDDMPTLMARCRDAYLAQQGLVVPVCDEDLADLLNSVGDGDVNAVERFFADRYRSIALGGR